MGSCTTELHAALPQFPGKWVKTKQNKTKKPPKNPGNPGLEATHEGWKFGIELRTQTLEYFDSNPGSFFFFIFSNHNSDIH